MPLTGAVDAANARVDLFVDYTTEVGTTTDATIYRRVGSPTADIEYVRGMFGSSLLGEQGYASDHEAPLDAQLWYIVVSSTGPSMTAGPFTIPSNGYVWLKDPGRPWADLKLDLCSRPSRGEAECEAEPVIYDTFSRVVADGWGTSDSGHPWGVSPGASAAQFDVDGASGIIGTEVVSSSRRALSSPTDITDSDITVQISPTVVATGGTTRAAIMTRIDPADIGATYYRAELGFTTAQTVTARLVKWVSNVETLLESVTLPGLTYTAGQIFHLRFQTRGQLLRMRVWPDGIAEGEEWNLSTTDASIPGPGRVGLWALRDAGNTNAPPVLTEFDEFALHSFTETTVDIAWVGFRDKQRAADAGLFPVLDSERPADVFARRKDITTGIMFLSRALDAITAVYELFTAGGPLLVQVPAEYGMNAPYGQRDRYYQPGDLDESYLSQDQRKVYRLWSAPATAVNAPIGEPQGTDTANWCALMETYPTMGDYAASGYTWAQAATGAATTIDLPGLYGSGPYGSGPYGG